MSLSTTIDLTLIKKDSAKINFKEIISCLQQKWSYTKDGEIYYLPEDDNDMFDWQNQKLSDDELLKLFENKKRNNEVIGLAMYHKENDTGMLMLLSNNTLSFSLSINTKMIDNKNGFKLVDINYYLMNTLPYLIKAGYIYEQVSIIQF